MYSALFGDKIPLMTSYTTFFGLNKVPFARIAVGNHGCVAPQVASAMAGIKKALAYQDAVVAVSGPVGSGKTTITRRALEKSAEFHVIVTIGRIQFAHDEVLELLLAGLGVRQLPKSTVHRFATFRRVLQQYSEQNTRVFILIEDATRVGLDALSELEAVTAADAGVSDGANLILLGDESLKSFLKQPQLARLKQRVRVRQEIAAQDQNELQGYLKHCFRLAGKEFDEIFSDDCLPVLHRLTDGIPRVVNNLLVAAMDAATEQQIEKIDAGLIGKIAELEFGLTGGHNVAEIEAVLQENSAQEPLTKLEPAPEPEPQSEPELAVAPQPELEPVTDPEPASGLEEDDEIPELIQDTLPDLQILAPDLIADEAAESAPDTGPEPAVQATPEPEPILEIEPPATAPSAEATAGDVVSKVEPVHEPTEFELPVLTGVFPEASIETAKGSSAGAPESAAEPEVTAAAEPEPEILPELKLEAEPAPEPELEPTPKPEPATVAAQEPAPAAVEAGEAAADVPDWEKDPTLAQLRPDLDALERAMAVAQGDDNDKSESVAAENLRREQAQAEAAAKAAAEEEASADIVPEITLDRQIQEKIEEATEALKQTQVDATADVTEELEATSKAPVAEPAAQDQAVSLDVPSNKAEKADQELEKIASELAKAKTLEDVDDMAAETLFGEEFSMMAAQVAANAPPIGEDTQVAKGTLPGETVEEPELALDPEPEADPAPQADADPMDTSSSQRLQALREMNHSEPPAGAPSLPEATESIVMSGGGVELPPAENSDSVDSIEDQIKTSMTQKMEALKIDHLPREFDDDDDDETVEKTGFLGGLFRRK